MIEKKDLALFKEPYFTTKLRGTGLGLAICEKIAFAHNGGLDLKIEDNNFKVIFSFKDEI
jgi:nitrogen fixation/metabolism regulation signal transduction histidine kinase